MRRIRVITPVITESVLEESEQSYAEYASSRTELSHVILQRGPASVESEYEEALALPDLLRQVKLANDDNMDAVIIDCASDPGLEAAREISTIPVIGVAQASFSLATMLAQRFSVIAILERDLPDMDRLFRQYGILDRVASVRLIDIPVLDLFQDHEGTTQAATEAALRSIHEDRAEAITFNCTGLSGVVRGVEENLIASGYHVPVIDPVAAGVKMAEGLVDLGLCHSKVTFPIPPEKKIVYP